MPRPSLKDKLLHAAVETLHRQGYHGCSIGDIAQAAGAPKGSVYNHFASKEELTVAALELYRVRDHAAFAALEDTALSAKERLRRHFAELSSVGHDMVEKGCLFGNMAAESSSQCPQVRAHMAGIFQDWTRRVEKTVKEARRKGELQSSIPARAFASFLINALEGALLRAKVECSRAPLADFRTVVFSLLLK